ncbi:unnamed protein product [Calypogeia fissa]
MVVPEASARLDVDGFYTVSAEDHFSVCRPTSRTSSNFRLLMKFVGGLLDEHEEMLSREGAQIVDDDAKISDPRPVRDDLEELCCDPITMDPMFDPVKCSDGRTYCRWTIICNSSMNRCPYDRSKKLDIVCDDITIRSLVFRVFPAQAKVFRECRDKYRQQALEYARADPINLAEVIEKLTNVLKWTPEDGECRNELVKVLGYLAIPEVRHEDVVESRLDTEGARLTAFFVLLFIAIWFFLFVKGTRACSFLTY